MFLYTIVYTWQGQREVAGQMTDLVRAWAHAEWFSKRWKVHCRIEVESMNAGRKVDGEMKVLEV